MGRVIHTQTRVTCGRCHDEFSVPSDYFQAHGTQPFCEDCVSHTTCHSCGEPLRLARERFEELGGDPIDCGDCVAARESTWDRMTGGQKLLLAGLAGASGYLFYTAQTGAASDPDQAVLLSLAAAGLAIWQYRRTARVVADE